MLAKQLYSNCRWNIPFLQSTVLPTITRPGPRRRSANRTQTPESSLLLAALSTAHVLLLFNIVKEFVLWCARHVRGRRKACCLSPQSSNLSFTVAFTLLNFLW